MESEFSRGELNLPSLRGNIQSTNWFSIEGFIPKEELKM
jgi:hypothetical protein